jgi:large subunit ribosomal protein L28
MKALFRHAFRHTIGGLRWCNVPRVCYNKNLTTNKFRNNEGIIMAMRCELCGKQPHFGNVISHANNTRRRRWNPNLKRMRALVGGVKKHIRVCTACIRGGRVKKAA